MNEKLEPRCMIQRNAQRITELHQRVHHTCKLRDTNPEARAEWSQACAEFHRQYDALAFPGGYDAGIQKIREGDAGSIEYALAFLEVRPFFFRSQYMRTKFLRLLKRATLTGRQVQRLEKVLEFEKEQRERNWRRHAEVYAAIARRRESGDAGQQ